MTKRTEQFLAMMALYTFLTIPTQIIIIYVLNRIDYPITAMSFGAFFIGCALWFYGLIMCWIYQAIQIALLDDKIIKLESEKKNPLQCEHTNIQQGIDERCKCCIRKMSGIMNDNLRSMADNMLTNLEMLKPLCENKDRVSK